MKAFLKFTAALTIAITLGVGSSIAALWHEAQSGDANVNSENPYARAAYAARDLLPSPSAPTNDAGSEP